MIFIQVPAHRGIPLWLLIDVMMINVALVYNNNNDDDEPRWLLINVMIINVELVYDNNNDDDNATTNNDANLVS